MKRQAGRRHRRQCRILCRTNRHYRPVRHARYRHRLLVNHGSSCRCQRSNHRPAGADPAALLGLVGERSVQPKLAIRTRKQGKPWILPPLGKCHGEIPLGYHYSGGPGSWNSGDSCNKMELGIPSGASANLDTPARQSYDVISKGFGEGFNGPPLVAQPKEKSDKISMETLGKLIQELQMHDNVTLVSPMGVNETGDIAIISLIPKTGPTDVETRDLVHDLRSPDSSLASSNNISLGVTGFTAINIDMSSKLSEAFPVYVGIIVILSIIILARIPVNHRSDQSDRRFYSQCSRYFWLNYSRLPVGTVRL